MVDNDKVSCIMHYYSIKKTLHQGAILYTLQCSLSMVTYNWDYILLLITCLNSLHVYCILYISGTKLKLDLSKSADQGSI